jgi:hypothetical protein
MAAIGIPLHGRLFFVNGGALFRKERYQTCRIVRPYNGNVKPINENLE